MGQVGPGRPGCWRDLGGDQFWGWDECAESPGRPDAIGGGAVEETHGSTLASQVVWRAGRSPNGTSILGAAEAGPGPVPSLMCLQGLTALLMGIQPEAEIVPFLSPLPLQ